MNPFTYDSWEPDEEQLADILVDAGYLPEYHASNYIPGLFRTLLNFGEELWSRLKCLG